VLPDSTTPQWLERQTRSYKVSSDGQCRVTAVEDADGGDDAMGSEVEIDLEPFRSETNKSGYRGVSWNAGRQNYRATISVNDRRTNLGIFDTVEEAAQAYARPYLRQYGAVPAPLVPRRDVQFRHLDLRRRAQKAAKTRALATKAEIARTRQKMQQHPPPAGGIPRVVIDLTGDEWVWLKSQEDRDALNSRRAFAPAEAHPPHEVVCPRTPRRLYTRGY
jgi:hypothetical protein